MKLPIQITHIIRSFFTPIALIHRDLGYYYRKNLKDFGVFLVGCLYGMFGIFFIVIAWCIAQPFHITNHKFTEGLFIVLGVLVFYFTMYIFYSRQQRTLVYKETIKLGQIFSSLQEENIPEKIYLIKDYIDQVNVLRSFGLFGYQTISKSTEAMLDALMQEVHTFISGLSFGGVENQEYFTLYADMQNDAGNHGFIAPAKHTNDIDRIFVLRPDSIRRGMNDIRVKWVLSGSILYYIAFFLFIILTFQIVYWDLDIALILPSAMLAYSGMTVASFFDRYSAGYIQMQQDSILNTFDRLCYSLEVFLMCKDSTIMLIKSEQGVHGIEPIIISKIAKNITYVMRNWDRYQGSLDHIYKLLSQWGNYLTPRNPYKFIQDIIDEEHLRGEKDLAEFQSILKSWMISHTKDLQNYQQEIHQIHQSLSQKNSANAEVIDLLEKNFNLHLQSAQKVENSI